MRKSQVKPALRRWEYIQTTHPAPPSPRDMDAYGADGWELIVVYNDNDPMRVTYYAVFKRELQ